MQIRRQWSLTAVRFAIVIALIALSYRPATAQEWTRFRGPNGAGISRATTVPPQWTEADWNWRVALPGRGHSSPVLWGKKLFVTSATESGQRLLLCLDADDGHLLWDRKFVGKAHRKHRLNSFASSTPAVDAEHVYLCWGNPEEYVVQAVDHHGKLVWQTDLGPFKASHGFGGSPIVHENLVIVGNEQEGPSSLVALDSRSGDVRWQMPRETEVTYVTPCVYRREGRPAEIIFTNWKHGVTAVDSRTGQTNWEISVFDQNHVETAIGSPVVADDLVLGTCGWLGYGSQTVAVRPHDPLTSPRGRGAEGETRAEEVYRFDRGAPLTTTPLVTDELLLLWADEGIVTCADVHSGRIHWQKRVGGTYYGSPVAAGDYVYCVSADGKAVVLAASKSYRLAARNSLGEGSHSTPAIADGVMYIRTFSHLISIGGDR